MLSVIPWRFRTETTLRSPVSLPNGLSKGERSCAKTLTNEADSCRWPPLWRPLAKASRDLAIALPVVAVCPCDRLAP